MNLEKEYYEFDGFWSDYNSSYKNNIEKIKISFEYIKPDVKTILDAACGNGIFTNMLAEKFPDLKVVAFDRSEAALKYVHTEKYLAEINNIPFKNEEFDCVVAHDVIEHLPIGIYEKSLSEIARVAKKYIIIGVPYDEKVLARSTQCPSCKAIFNYDLHMRSFSKSKMQNLFKDFGFDCVEIRTCDKNTFYYGQKLYGEIFYAKNSKRFKSPICPVCGYEENIDNENKDKTNFSIVKTTFTSKFITAIKKFLKSAWPQYSFDYEMVALFAKK